jgi:hypothetical protein
VQTHTVCTLILVSLNGDIFMLGDRDSFVESAATTEVLLPMATTAAFPIPLPSTLSPFISCAPHLFSTRLRHYLSCPSFLGCHPATSTARVARIEHPSLCIFQFRSSILNSPTRRKLAYPLHTALNFLTSSFHRSFWPIIATETSSETCFGFRSRGSVSRFDVIVAA